MLDLLSWKSLAGEKCDSNMGMSWMARDRAWLCRICPTWNQNPCTHFTPLPLDKILHPSKTPHKVKFAQGKHRQKEPLPQFSCTHQLPATLLITHCPCKLIQLRETSPDDYKMLQSQYCFRPAESKFIKHLLFKAAVVINACLHL